MGFSAKQLKALQRQPNRSHIRTRKLNGRELSYLEGWYAISEANRIFGFDGWSRETLESRAVLARENRGSFLAVYLARVRVTVKAGGTTILREGHGTGEGRGTSPGEVHDIALKAAETDATKRALATFGKPFGLELYRGVKAGKATLPQRPLPVPQAHALAMQDKPAVPATAAVTRYGLHPDDTTPIPRPSRYYGRRHNLLAEQQLAEALGKRRQQSRRNVAERAPMATRVSVPTTALEATSLAASDNHAQEPALDTTTPQASTPAATVATRDPVDSSPALTVIPELQSPAVAPDAGVASNDPATPSADPPLVPEGELSAQAPQASPQALAAPAQLPELIDESRLALSKSRRLRDRAHLKFVASQACLVCGRQPCDPHHLRFAQPRAIGMKVSDEFTVPLCRIHHRELHRVGNELAWWQGGKIEPLAIARALWRKTHPISDEMIESPRSDAGVTATDATPGALATAGER